MRCVKNNFMFKKTFSKLTPVLVLAASGFYASVAWAAILPTAKPCAASPNGCGDYSLDDMLTLGVNVANWILGVVGALALLFFVYGGFVFILSGGSEEKVREGKTVLMNAIIGLAVVFCSYLIVQFVAQNLLGVKGVGAGLKINF